MTNDSNTTDERNELAAMVAGSFRIHSKGVAYVDHTTAADAILAAGYRKPRTITTFEELDTLPDEAVVRSDFGVIHEKRVGFDTDRVFWVCPGDTDEHTAGKITLPATVLHEPEAEGTP